MFTKMVDSIATETRKMDAARRRESDRHLKMAAGCDGRTRSEHLMEAWAWAKAARVKPGTFALKAERLNLDMEDVFDMMRGF